MKQILFFSLFLWISNDIGANVYVYRKIIPLSGFNVKYIQTNSFQANDSFYMEVAGKQPGKIPLEFFENNRNAGYASKNTIITLFEHYSFDLNDIIPSNAIFKEEADKVCAINRADLSWFIQEHYISKQKYKACFVYNPKIPSFMNYIAQDFKNYSVSGSVGFYFQFNVDESAHALIYEIVVLTGNDIGKLNTQYRYK